MNNLKLSRFETCDYALISQEGKLSIIGLFDKIFVQNLPAQHSSMAVVVVAEGSPKSDHKIRFLIQDPSRKQLIDTSMNIKTNDMGYFNVIANFNNLPITQQGIMTIECFDGDIQLGTKEIIISKSPVLQGSKAKN